MAIKELVNNIRDHAETDTGFIHIQWHPKKNEICLSVSDFGVGIPTEMRRRYPDTPTDHEAILAATNQGVSSKRGTAGGRNMGEGLSVLIDSVVLAHRGSVAIHSGYGTLTTNGASNGVVVRNNRAARDVYPGTLVSIALGTSGFIEEEEYEEELEW